MILAGSIDTPESIFWIVSHEKDSDGKGRLREIIEDTALRSEDYSNLAEMLAEFIVQKAQRARIYSVMLSVPGPVQGRGALADIQRPAWGPTQAEEVAKSLPAEVPVVFLNDMEAMGHGIFSTKGEEKQLDIEELNVSGAAEASLEAEESSMVLLTVGNGFGQSFWSWNVKKNEFSVLPSEGGHADLASRSGIEIEFYRFLKQRNEGGAVSCEQALSANGIRSMYEFLADKAGEREIEHLPTVHEIISHSNEKTDLLAVKTMELFSAIFGAEAGNIALRYLPAGGIYLAGGLIPEMLPSLKRDNIFMESFSFKEGAFREYNEKIPVRIVKDEKLCLWGSAAKGLPLLTRGYWVYRRTVGA